MTSRRRVTYSVMIIMGLCFLCLGAPLLQGSLVSGWEAHAEVYGVQVGGDLRLGAGPHDFDGPLDGYPDVVATVSAIQHCDAQGQYTPNTWAADVRVVTIGDTDYVFALHYYRFTMKVRTVADAQPMPLQTETNRPNPNPVDPRIGLGRPVSPTVWATIAFQPWDAIQGAEERWVGIMTVQLLDSRAGVEEGQPEADAGTSADPVVNPGSALTMYSAVAGAQVGSQNWHGVAPDTSIRSTVAVKVTPTMEAGYHDVMGGWFGLQLLDVQAVDVYVAYDVIVEVLVLGAAVQSGGAVDWDDAAGKNVTTPVWLSPFDVLNTAFQYWGDRLDAFGGWMATGGALWAAIVVPVSLMGVTLVALWYLRRRP